MHVSGLGQLNYLLEASPDLIHSNSIDIKKYAKYFIINYKIDQLLSKLVQLSPLPLSHKDALAAHPVKQQR